MTQFPPDGDDSLERRLLRLNDNTYEGPAAVARLRRMEIEIQDLRDAVMAYEMERQGTSPLEPPFAAGSRAWFGGCRVSAERFLVRENWERKVEGNIPRLFNRQTRIAVTVCSGDAAVGLRGRWPRSRNPKGTESAEFVQTNGIQLNLFEDAPPSRWRPLPRTDDLVTWVLLIYSDDTGTLRAELSLPVGIDDSGFFSDWQERILINVPSFDGGLRTNVDEDDTPELEVTVRPRA